MMTRKNLAIFKLYDMTKGGTDTIDQWTGSFPTKFKSSKWTMVALNCFGQKSGEYISSVCATEQVEPQADQLFQLWLEFCRVLDHTLSPAKVCSRPIIEDTVELVHSSRSAFS